MRRKKDRSNRQSIDHFEYRIFSQNGEDGILDYIFSEIGFESKTFVEFGFHSTQSNCLNLIMRYNFGGLFIDRSRQNCDIASSMFKFMRKDNVNIVKNFITRETINSIIDQKGCKYNVDILSIDIDGNDYWVWESIDCISPRVVVIEYNDWLDSNLPLTIQYDPDFDLKKAVHEIYFGASLMALQKLGKRKRYRLVGCDSAGVNAFFLRDDVHAQNIKTVTVEDAFNYQKRTIDSGFTYNARCDLIKTLPFVEV